MSNSILQPAYEKVVNKWRIWSGITIASQVATSLTALIINLKNIFPENLILENYVYLALAIAFITALPLFVIPKVISLSLAQLGGATSLLFLGYSLNKVFQPDYNFVIILILLVIVIIYIIIFLQAHWYYLKKKNWADLIVEGLLLLVFIVIWFSLIKNLWR